MVHVALQEMLPTLWIDVDLSGNPTLREFQIFGTGDRSIPASARHVGTVQQGAFVWHVFERVV